MSQERIINKAPARKIVDLRGKHGCFGVMISQINSDGNGFVFLAFGDNAETELNGAAPQGDSHLSGTPGGSFDAIINGAILPTLLNDSGRIIISPFSDVIFVRALDTINGFDRLIDVQVFRVG